MLMLQRFPLGPSALLRRPLTKSLSTLTRLSCVALQQKQILWKVEQQCHWKRDLSCEYVVPRTKLVAGTTLLPVQTLSSLKRPWYWFISGWDWALLAGVTLAAMTTAVVQIWVPRVIGRLVNVISTFIQPSNTGSTGVLWNALRDPSLYLLGLFMGQAWVALLGERVAARIRCSLYASLLKQDMAFFDERRSGELMDRLTADVADFKHSFKACLSQGLKSATQIVGSAIQLYQISNQMTFLLLLAGPIFYGIGNWYGAFLRQISKDAKQKDANAAAIAGEALGNIRTVRAFANEPFELERYTHAVQEANYANSVLGFHIGVFQGFTNFSIGSMVMFVLFYGGSLVANNELSGGDLMSYLLSIQNTQKSLAQIGVLIAQAFKASSAYTRLNEFIDLCPTIPLTGGSKILGQGNIQFNSVNFAYPSRPDHLILKDFQLDIQPGQVVALCGSSGAGKSTLAALIERFYDPLSGDITIDGFSLKQLDPSFMRKQIGYISQEPVLFATSILENIRYANPSASMEEVERVARLANAAEFIEQFPDKYETLVGERGVSLSGGQRQRIAIARTLLKDPKILIFDEATSALDSESERVVQEALERLMKGRTVVIIAHRLSTIENADKIIVLARGGRIIESGRHEELMAMKAAYYKLYSRLHDENDS